MNIQIFENKDFGQIRIVDKNGEVWFIANDVARALGYLRTADAVREHCKGVSEIPTPTSGGIQRVKIIPESDFYRLVLRSKMPKAEEFQDWVCGEVLPSIRKTGSYSVSAVPQLSDDALILAAMTKLQNRVAEQAKKLEVTEQKVEEQAKQIEQERPKVAFADSVACSRTDIKVGVMAKILNQNGYDVGQNRFFETLREEGFLISRRGSDWNMPTQKAMELGLFRVQQTCITHSDGHTTIERTPKVTGKGQIYFVNKYCPKKNLFGEKPAGLPVVPEAVSIHQQQPNESLSSNRRGFDRWTAVLFLGAPAPSGGTLI
jgi:anti-repressor protein